MTPGERWPGTLGLGMGWRPELAHFIDRHPGLGFVELLAEDFEPRGPLPPALENLRERGMTFVLHGVSLSLGGAAPPEPRRLEHLARVAERVGAVLVSDHVCFVRAGGLESGHLLPVPRTREMLEVLVENVRLAREALPVPLALENIATLVEWPSPELDEATLLAELVERTDTLLLLDLANLHANARNHGWEPLSWLERLPWERLAYVHMAGGVEQGGRYHDTHAHPLPREPLELLAALCERTRPPGVLLERDDHFPPDAELAAELDAITGVLSRGEGAHAVR
ncbi:MAG TPA: DUF692 domain-containing protein [Archangium sp.]|uniref:DUF692 domain-containing protein n=1 Tax=Archangium sp. TaxID=1872627 RepID=UPI002E33B7E4|nr:DUF692 domain-containing protein [Archangium sp.]HEX5752497.1 DUF692 domain-containing protein [Archangium sp.]